jgi:tetratricopeptide (TPR) repeat protein
MWSLAAGLMLAAAVSRTAALAAEGPSIEEMLKDIDGKLSTGAEKPAPGKEPAPPAGEKPPTPTPAQPAATTPASPAAQPAAAPTAPPPKFQRYEPKSDAIGKLKDKINASVVENQQDFDKKDSYWPLAMLYLDIQRYPQSAEILVNRFLSGKAPRRQAGPFDNGEAHREAARVLAILGRPKEAEAAAAESVQRATAPHLQRMADAMVRWVAEYPQKRLEHDWMEYEFSKNPADAELRWRLCDSYRRCVSQNLDEIIALQDMIERFPQHPMSARGEVEWRLAEGYDRFFLSDDALPIYLHVDKEHPDYGQVKGGECWWRIAEKFRAQGKWKEARDFYQRMAKDSPGHYCCQLQFGQMKTTVTSRVEECNQHVK